MNFIKLFCQVCDLRCGNPFAVNQKGRCQLDISADVSIWFSNQRLFDYDHSSSLLKIIANGGAIEYTEYQGAVPTWTKTNIYLGDSQLSTITSNGAGGEITEYNHPDRLGTRLVTNQQNGTNYEQAHLPFGKALSGESTGATSKRFTSYERSSQTGLDYAQNRYFASKHGRFTSVDPLTASVSVKNPQNFNW